MADFYRYQSYDGNLYEGLTLTQMLKMKQDEELLQKQQAENARLQPMLEAAYTERYGQTQAAGQPGAMPESGGAMTAIAEPPSQAVQDSMARPSGQGAAKLGQQSFGDAIDTAVAEQQQEATGAELFQGTPSFDTLVQDARTGGPMEQMAPSGVPGAPGTQAAPQDQMSVAMQNFLQGVPDDIARDLFAQWKMKTLKPNAFIKQVADIKKTLRGEETERKKSEFEHGLKLEQTAAIQDPTTQRARMNIESAERLARLAREDQDKTPEGIDPIDNIAAQALAYEIGKSRGMKDVYPTIIAGLRTGKTINDIRDEIRFSQQSENFNEIARQGLQQVFTTAGKSGKSVDLAFDAFDDLLQKNDMEGAKDYLKNAAQKSYGVTLAQQIIGKERTVEFLDEIKNDLNAYEKEGGDTNIFTGNLEKVAKAAGSVKDERLRSIATKIASAIQQYRRSMSGVAFSVPESKEYGAMFPGIDKTSSFNMATLGALQEVFSGDVAHLYKNAMGEDAYNTFIRGGGPATKATPGNTAEDYLAEIRAEREKVQNGG